MMSVRGTGVGITRTPYIVAFAVIATAAVVAATLYYRAFRTTLLSDAREKLRLVAELKVSQIQEWRRERLGDAEVLAHNPAFGKLVARALAEPTDRSARDSLVEWLQRYLKPFSYDRVSILDARGHERIVVPQRHGLVCPVVRANFRRILESDGPVFLDLHTAELEQAPRLSIALRIAVPHSPDGAPETVAVLVLRSDPSRDLYPMIQRWPSVSPTSETLLVRREHDSVLYLNELRLRRDTALKLRLPLSRRDLLAAQAVRGAVGAVEGTDYRGVPVLGYVHPIPDSPWFLIARVDMAEVMEPARKLSGLLILIVGMLVLLTALSLGTIWSRQRRTALDQELAAALALTEGENRYRLVLDNMAEGYLLVGHDHRILYLNPAGSKQMGAPSAQVVGKSVSECFPGLDRTDAWEALTACLADRTPQSAELRLSSAEGEETVLAIMMEPVNEGALILALDVSTERRQAERIAESEQTFRTLTETMAEGVALHELIYDSQGQAVDYRIVYANPAFTSHTGIPLDKVVGRTASEAYGSPPPFLEEYARVAATGEHFETEVFYEPLGRHFRLSAACPRPGMFATVFEDISDRVNRERQLADKTAEMERFTYAASHDLRSPLVTVMTFLGYLREHLGTGDIEAALSDITFAEQAGCRMNQLLDELLHVSRVGRAGNPPKPTTFHSIVRDALAATAGRLTARGVAVEIQGDDVPLFGDVPRLVEVVQNLVDNAAKFMGDQTEPRIEIGAEGAGRDTVFYVRDNGIGLEPRHQARVFGMFTKLDPHTPGMGAGLALVKRIVEYYGGKITVDSAGANAGACFRFTLPDAVP